VVLLARVRDVFTETKNLNQHGRRDVRDIERDQDLMMLAENGKETAADCFTLMRPFKMIMLDELSDCLAQRRFTKEDELRQTLAFDRAYPAFREGVQIGTAGWQCERLNGGRLKGVSKGSTELAAAIVENETNRKQSAVDCIDRPASHLHHRLDVE
jgi:hypothetical protein